MLIRMFNEPKEGLKQYIQNELNESQQNTDKKLEKTQKQLNELREISTNSKMNLRRL
jgi:uncharacterized protein involved in exopolysaccharide biosynthesis